MAPDKIYLHEISAEELTENLPYHVCYIRKDALLEFPASLEKDSAKNAGTDDLAYAAHEMVCTLIEKILGKHVGEGYYVEVLNMETDQVNNPFEKYGRTFHYSELNFEKKI